VAGTAAVEAGRRRPTLIDKITAIHTASRRTYGAPRVHVELREDHGIRCGRKRAARLMKAAGLPGV
jgi:transposase InsO family protein